MLIVQQIKKLIENGELVSGQQLPSEREMAEQFGVGRSTIREALTALEIINYIVIKQGLGTFVASSSPNLKKENILSIVDELEKTTSPSELFEARMYLEPEIAYIAAQRATKEDLNNIQETLSTADSIGVENIEKFEELDRLFHSMVAKAAHNEVLLRLEEDLTSERFGALWGKLKYHSFQIEGRMDKYRVEHRQIYNAIKEKDGDKARKMVRKHLSDVRGHLFDDLS
jgi:DNA-binding FadR family transcriptional regulator